MERHDPNTNQPNINNETASKLGFDRRDLIKATTLGFVGSPLLGRSVDAQEAIAEGPTVYAGTTWRDDKLYAVDAKTGEEIWRYDEGLYTPYSTPTVVDGTIYVGYDNGPRGSLHAVDAVTGDQEWIFEAGDWVRTSPTVVGEIVYIASHDQNLYAVYTDSGEKKWEFSMDDRGMNGGGPAVAEGVVYTGTKAGSLYAVDAETGEQIWKYTDAPGGQPTFYNGIVYFASDNLYALNAESGTEEWIFGRTDGVSTPVVQAGIVYVGTGGDDRSVYALDAATGEVEWETPEYSGRPTLSDGMVYVDSGSSLVALDRDSGDLQWKFTEPTDSLFPPTVNNDTVYVGSKDNTLYAVDTMTGSKKWEFTNASHHVRTPTIVETPDGGDSVGSRVNLGLFGHHHVWAESSVTPEEGDSDTDDTNVLDNVSDGSIAEYTDYINNYSVTGERSYTGDYAITAVGGDNAFLADDGEIGTVSQGTIFSMRAYLESSAAEVGILFGVQSEGRKNWYNAEYKAPQKRLAIFRDNETRSTETVGNKNGVELPAEEWLQFKITWDDGTLGGNSGDITFTIQRESGEVLHEIAGNNTFYTSGGIGYNNQADVAYYDYYRKHSTDMTEEPVNKYTDTDGYVDSEGLLDAGADYRNGEIDEDRLNEVASAFRSGEPVS